MDFYDLGERLLTALAIGLVIGLERGWQARDEPEGERAAGLRTLALSGLLGGVWGAIARLMGDGGALALGLAFLAFTATIAIFRLREAVADHTFGATTLVAAMLAFALGAFAVIGDKQLAAAAGIAVAGILAFKGFLHAWLKRLSWVELRAALVLLAMTFILLPLLPNRTIDPWSAINPFELWLMTIMIAVISFAGYIALKIADERTGVAMTAIAGGLTSSTAVTLTFARLVREHPGHRDALVAGILLSCATMMVRVLAIVAVMNLALLQGVALPITFAAAAAVAIAVYFLRGDAGDVDKERRISLKNPFELGTVLKFGALLTAVTVTAKLAASYAGARGIYAVAAVSGLVDVDAVTLSMARLGLGSIDAAVAARAVLLVVAVNTLSKTALGWFAGGRMTGAPLVLAAMASVVAGLAGYFAG